MTAALSKDAVAFGSSDQYISEDQSAAVFYISEDQSAAGFSPPPDQNRRLHIHLTRPQRELVADIQSMVLLPPDWDGEGAPSVEASTAQRAANFVIGLRAKWLPKAMPITEGGVRIEWGADAAFLILDFVPHGVEVVFSDGLPGSKTSVWENHEIPHDLDPFFARVLSVRSQAK